MSTEKTKAPKFFIKGTARYPKTATPYRYDRAQEKSVVDLEKGKYSLEVIVDGDEANKFIRQIQDYAAENGFKVKNVKNWPFKDEVDSDDNETGNVIFKAFNHATSKSGEPRSIPHFDAKAKPLGKDFKLTGGSTVIMACRPSTFKELGGGVTMYLDGVQVLKYVPYTGANPGFTAQEGFASSDDDEDGDESGGFTADNDNDSEDDPTDF
jgi:hypothetical protein